MIRRDGVSRATKPSRRRVGANKMARAKTKTEEATEKEAPVPEAETKTEEATEKEGPVPEAETKTEEATEKEAPVPEADTIDDAKALHALLAAYFTALASLKSPP